MFTIFTVNPDGSKSPMQTYDPAQYTVEQMLALIQTLPQGPTYSLELDNGGTSTVLL
jgi:hypothetical protein